MLRLRRLKEKPKLALRSRESVLLIWIKTGRNGIRVGDLELETFKQKYKSLAKKHVAMIDFYDVEIQYDLDEMETEFFESIEKLKKLTFIDSEEYLNQAIKSGKTILAEGAQGSLLDIDFGTYPFVTSSNTTAAGACTGLGVAPGKINEVYGIFKALHDAGWFRSVSYRII